MSFTPCLNECELGVKEPVRKYILKYISICITFLFTILSLNNVNAFAVNPNQKPNIGGNAAILMDVSNNKVLYEKNIHKKLPMASTTKILTAILAIEKGNLNSTVTVPYEASVVDGSKIYLKAGEKVKLEDLLYGLMLTSGNDAAITIAKYIGGTEKKFCDMMNEKAKQIGAMESSFMNPHGLDDPKHYTTAYDLALITSYALKNKEFRKIVSTKRWTMPWQDHDYNRVLINKNKMLYRYNDAIGVKIGYTKRTGRCLVAAAERNNLTLISVVLQNGDWWNACSEMLDYGFKNYESKCILSKCQMIKSVKVIDGVKCNVKCSNLDDCYITMVKGEKQDNSLDLKINLLKKVKAPIKQNQTLGEISVFINGKLEGMYPLSAINSVEKKQTIKNKLFKNMKRILENIL